MIRDRKKKEGRKERKKIGKEGGKEKETKKIVGSVRSV